MKTILQLVLTGILSIGIFACKIQKTTVQSPIETVAADELKSIEIQGEEIHYIEQGMGEPLIFIHGTVGDYRAWITRMDPYAENYHVIAYSRRYAWPNKKVFDEQADYSVRIHADDLYTLIQELDLDKVHLVGHSYGAYTALSMALAHPETVQSLVLGEPPAAPLLENIPEGKSSFDSFMQNNLRPAATAFRADQNEKGVEFFLKGVLGDEFSISQVPPEVKQRWLDNLPEVWGAAMTESFLNLDPEKIKTLDVPVLLLTGDRSPTWFGAISKELHRLLPRSELVTVENSSHGLYFENPEDVDMAVREFLKKY